MVAHDAEAADTMITLAIGSGRFGAQSRDATTGTSVPLAVRHNAVASS
jgi:hypothetical protein